MLMLFVSDSKTLKHVYIIFCMLFFLSILLLADLVLFLIRGGDWNTGGGCHSETLPDLGFLPTQSDMHFSTVANVLPQRANKSEVLNLDLLNVTQMSARRKDGHASIYYIGPQRTASMQRQDCSHWCLPGVPDSWNEILYSLFLKKTFSGHNSTEVSQVSL